MEVHLLPLDRLIVWQEHAVEAKARKITKSCKRHQRFQLNVAMQEAANGEGEAEAAATRDEDPESAAKAPGYYTIRIH